MGAYLNQARQRLKFWEWGKETVNKAALNEWKVKGLGVKRLMQDEFRSVRA